MAPLHLGAILPNYGSALGGGAADESRAGRLGALALSGDPVSEATRMTALMAARE